MKDKFIKVDELTREEFDARVKELVAYVKTEAATLLQQPHQSETLIDLLLCTARIQNVPSYRDNEKLFEMVDDIRVMVQKLQVPEEDVLAPVSLEDYFLYKDVEPTPHNVELLYKELMALDLQPIAKTRGANIKWKWQQVALDEAWAEVSNEFH